MGGVDLAEEASQALRAAPAGALAAYYAGTLPFVLGSLYFWADMSRNPFARQHIAEASLGLALLFLWMKFWQAVFARKMRAQVAAEAEPAWSAGRAWRVLLAQSAIQPWGLFVLPLALIAVLPFPTVYAFFQNATVLDDGEPRPLGALVKKASRLAILWPGQMTIALLVALAFAFFVELNWITVCYMLPQLGRTLLGIESVFTRSGFHLFNTTFLATTFGLTYLSVDPLAKTMGVLRCFYGESVKSGEDLKSRLKRFALEAPVAVVVLIFALGVGAPGSLRAESSAGAPASAPVSAPAAQPAVAPDELDRSINQVIHEEKYAWRLPREKADETDEAEQGIIGQFIHNVAMMLREWASDAWHWFEKMVEKLWPGWSPRGIGVAPSLWSTITSLQVLMFALIAVVLCTLGVFLFRLWQNRVRGGKLVQSAPLASVPDLRDENVGAEQLPEDGWTKLARELMERGEYRLALRAFYLAGLAHLAGRNLISLARFKSNRDYERELGRRGHAIPQLSPAFGEMVATFERVWYGLHEANGELVGRFTLNVDKLKAAQ